MNWSYIKENINSILFFGISWITSTFFLLIAICRVNLDEIDKTPRIIWYFLMAGIIFLFLPFFKKVKIGKFLELEREIKNTKEELNSFKTDIKQTLSIISTNVNTLSTINNQIQINIPGIVDLQNAIKTLETQTNPQIEKSSQEIKEEIIIEDEDNIMALTKARVKVEYLLRKILGKRIILKNSEKDIKYLTLTQLMRDFLDEFPQYRYLENSLSYVRRIGNAAAHAQIIPEYQAQEAIDMSLKLIGVLKFISEEQ